MKLHGDMEINGRAFKKGDEISWLRVYPFFMVHIGMFGLSGFYMAYVTDGPSLGFLFVHGGLAILTYTIFYLIIFGQEEVKWMFINAALGLLGIYAEIDWILAFFGTSVDDYPWQRHIIPFLYYVLYTFLLRQAFIDLTRSREDPDRRRRVNQFYVGLSVLIYGAIYLF